MAEPIKTKTCRVCKQTKTLSEFHKDLTYKNNLKSECKTCHLEYQRENRKTEKGKIAKKRYEQSQKNKDARNSHPKHRKAQNAVNHAIRDGKLPRANTKLCHYCPKPAQQYHHRHGYELEHWLDVVPICKKCHYLCHRKVAC